MERTHVAIFAVVEVVWIFRVGFVMYCERLEAEYASCRSNNYFPVTRDCAILLRVARPVLEWHGIEPCRKIRVSASAVQTDLTSCADAWLSSIEHDQLTRCEDARQVETAQRRCCWVDLKESRCIIHGGVKQGRCTNNGLVLNRLHIHLHAFNGRLTASRYASE